MSQQQIFATFFLYNAIFIEQKLDLDQFGSTEQHEIINVTHTSFIVLRAFIKNDQDIYKAQQFIQQHFPRPLLTIGLDTLQDIIALDNNIHNYLSKEIPHFQKLGKYCYNKFSSYIPDSSYALAQSDELFSTIMFCVELMLILDQNNYSFKESLEALADHEYYDEFHQIVNALK